MGKPPDIRHIFDQILRDFEPNHSPKPRLVKSGNGYTVKEYQIGQDPKYYIRDPYLIFIIFVTLKDYKYKGRDEKEAWTVYVKFKGEPFLLTFRKFGFRIISSKQSDKITDLGREAMYKIFKAIPYAEELIQPLVKEKVQKGNITLENHYDEILCRYNFFKKKAIEQFVKGANPRYKTTYYKKKGKPTGSSMTQDLAGKNRIAGNNYGIAMMDVYFSLLEHLLVLMLPFISGIDHDKMDVEEFILKNWKEKIKAIVPLADPKAGKLYKTLLDIKENLRNPLTHGHFQKDGNSIYVHMKTIGAIPMNLSRRERQFTYSSSQIYHENFNSIVQCFEGFIEFLSKNESTCYAMAFIKKGLSVTFDQKSRELYRDAMTDMETFERFLYYREMDEVNAMNMDW
jgi:hypothetical protein